MQAQPASISVASRLAWTLAFAVLCGCSEDRSAAPAPTTTASSGSNDPPAVKSASAPRNAVAESAKPAAAKQEEPTAPVYEFVPPKFELGLLEPNQEQNLTFELFNRSTRAFAIAQITTDCKCLSLHFDHDQIEPGKSAKIQARILGTTSGGRTTAATAHLSDMKKTKARIEFHYAIIPEVIITPNRIDFGRVETGKSSEASVEVTMRLPDVLTSDPPLEPFLEHALPVEIAVDSPTVKPSAKGFREWKATVHAKLSSKQPIPAFTSNMVFQAKDKKAFRTTLLQIKGEVISAWYFERGVLAFGLVKVGAEETRSMRFFYPAGEEPPKVLDLSVDSPDFEVSQTLDAPKHCYVITIRCIAKKSGHRDAKVSFKTSLSDEPSVLRVTARVH